MKRLAVIVTGILTPEELAKKVEHMMMRFVSSETEVKAFLFSGPTRSNKVGGDVSLLAGETKDIAIKVDGLVKSRKTGL